MSGDWTAKFPGLDQLSPAIRQELSRAGRQIDLPAGARLFGPGQSPESFLLLASGSVRVQQVSESGREIVLFRIVAGESCPLTTSCLLSHAEYPAEAVSETPVAAVAVSRAAFDDLVGRSPEFRCFVFTAFTRRITDLLRLIDEVAFQRLDIRLAAKLLDRAQGRSLLRMTHHELAAELGTAREVVSRQLHELQRRGLVTVTRGEIEIRDRAGLQRLAAAL